ncbi:MAG TPA: twin-arginine translocation signal domain-containing protein [Anaerolineaceae bacterium]
MSNQVTRRELLKVLAASGGAVAAASFLPGKWVKPLVKAGVLPAHAQSSQNPPTVSNLVVHVDGSFFNSTNQKAFPTGVPLNASFQYNDPLGGVTNAAKLYITVDTCGTFIDGSTIADLQGFVSSNQFVGSVNGVKFNTCSNWWCCSAFPSPKVYLKMLVGSRLSNEISGDIEEKCYI